MSRAEPELLALPCECVDVFGRRDRANGTDSSCLEEVRARVERSDGHAPFGGSQRGHVVRRKTAAVDLSKGPARDGHEASLARRNASNVATGSHAPREARDAIVSAERSVRLAAQKPGAPARDEHSSSP